MVNNRRLLQYFVACREVLHPELPENPQLSGWLDPRLNPWFRRGQAVLFLAVQGPHVVGRVAAFIEPRLPSPHHGYFGLLETIADPGVCSQLLGQVEEWLARRGKSLVIGPVVFNSNYGMGLLVEGDAQPDPFNLPVNPPYYASLLSSLGYIREKDFLAYTWSTDQEIPNKFQRAAQRAQSITALAIRTLTSYPRKKQIELFATLYRDTMQEGWEFAPLDRREIEGILLTFRNQSRPELLLMAEMHGEPAGFSLTVLGIRGGQKCARLAVLGLAPRFRHRGIEASLLVYTLARLREERVKTVDLSYIAEDNQPVTRLLTAAGVTPNRRYRVYHRSLVAKILQSKLPSAFAVVTSDCTV